MRDMNSLRKERCELIDKKFLRGLDDVEFLRLKEIEDLFGKIEEEKLGPDLARLEKFASDIERLNDVINKYNESIRAIDNDLLNIKFSFKDWTRGNNSVYGDEYELSLGNFHSGTVFNGSIVLSKSDRDEFIKALKGGAVPVFDVLLDD